MKKAVTILATIVCCAFLMGTGRYDAPVLPSKNFYINDYADILYPELRDAMLDEARKLNESTGAQAVLLTANGLEGMDGEQYASLIFNGWDIGGPTRENGVLILIDTDGKRFYALGSEDIPNITAEEWNKSEALIRDGEFAKGAGTCYFAYINAISAKHGAGAVVNIDDMPEKPDKKGLPEARYSVIIGGFAVIILIRILRVSLSTSKRVKKRNTYGARSFSVNRTNRNRRRYDDDYPSGFSGSIVIKNHIYNDDFDDVGTVEEARSKIEARVKEDGIEFDIVDERR